MFRKTIMLSLITLLCIAPVSGVVFAAAEEPPPSEVEMGHRGRFAVRGEVVGINPAENSFALRTPRGDILGILVDEATRMRGIVSAFEDLRVGMLAGVVGFALEEGPRVARMVFVPRLRNQIDRYQGKVVEIDLRDQNFSIKTPRQDLIKFEVNEQTRYQGVVSRFENLKVGSPALVVAKAPEDGESPLAVLVFVPKRVPPARVAGTIETIDDASATFNVQTQRGEIRTIQVDENTKFRSRDNEIGGLEDLELEMQVMVAGRFSEDQNGVIQAMLVVAGNLDSPRFDLTVRGVISAVDTKSFNLQTGDGRDIGFQITEDTKFHSRGGEIQGVTDLEPGMKVVVAAVRLEDGGYQAKLVGIII